MWKSELVSFVVRVPVLVTDHISGKFPERSYLEGGSRLVAKKGNVFGGGKWAGKGSRAQKRKWDGWY